MNVLLALSLIFVFYYLFMLHDSKNKHYIEHFTENNVETSKLLTDINLYLNKRVSNPNSSVELMKVKILSGNTKSDSFIEPVVVNKHVETNETKIMSDSPTYIPTNLYVNGGFVISNKDTSSSKLSKNLCMGENCYSEQDLLYIIQDLLPYYKYNSNRDREIKELCFESYETIKSMFELPSLEPEAVKQGLDYKGQLLALREIVKEYDLDLSNSIFFDSPGIKINVGSSRTNSKKIKLPFPDMVVSPTPANTQNSNWRDRFSTSVDERDLTVTRTDHRGGWGQDLILMAKPDFSEKNIDKNVILANSYRTDYNLINFLEKYPSVMEIFLKTYSGSIPSGDKYLFVKTFREEALSNYETVKNSLNLSIDEITRGNCINGEHLKILKGETPIKLTTDDEKVEENLKLTNFENIHTKIIDDMRRWYKQNNRLKRDYAGSKNVQIYDDNNIYYDSSIKLPEDQSTDKAYLNEQHFEVHGLNDDDNDCMRYKKLKIATMSKSKRGDELQRNGVFEIEKVNGKTGETGVFCKPT